MICSLHNNKWDDCVFYMLLNTQIRHIVLNISSAKSNKENNKDFYNISDTFTDHDEIFFVCFYLFQLKHEYFLFIS